MPDVRRRCPHRANSDEDWLFAVLADLQAENPTFGKLTMGYIQERLKKYMQEVNRGRRPLEPFKGLNAALRRHR